MALAADRLTSCPSSADTRPLKQRAVLNKHIYLRDLRWRSLLNTALMKLWEWAVTTSKIFRNFSSRFEPRSNSFPSVIRLTLSIILLLLLFFCIYYLFFCILLNQHAIRDCWHNTPFKLISFKTHISTQKCNSNIMGIL